MITLRLYLHTEKVGCNLEVISAAINNSKHCNYRDTKYSFSNVECVLSIVTATVIKALSPAEYRKQ